MKFSNVIKGKKAEEKIEVPGFTDTEGKPWSVVLQPLTVLEYTEACAEARAHAVSKGVQDPKLGEPIYDLALASQVLVRGCVDPDSPEQAREKSFNSAEEIMKEMHPEHVVYLHTRHECWQDECSPTNEKINDDNMLDALREVAGPDGIATFMRFSPNMQVNFAISMAKTLWPLLEARSLPGSSSVSDTSNEESVSNSG